MKHLKITKFIALVFLIVFASCENDDNLVTPTEPTPTESTGVSANGFVMSLKTTGGEETEFIVSKEDIMTGEISAVGEGIEQTSWRFYYPVDNTLFAVGYSDDNLGQSYTSNEDELVSKITDFTFENTMEMFGHDDSSNLLAMEISREEPTRRLHTIDANTGLVTNIIDINIFQELDFIDLTQSVLTWPTALEVRGDNLFIPFHKIKPSFETTDPDVAYVAVYSYPAIGEPTIISDTRTSNIGVNGTTTGLVETESGDLYSFSCGTVNAGFSVASTKPSGILRINANELAFDQDYFFNIEEATNGGKIFSLDYAFGNKAVARILTSDTGVPWEAFSRDAGAFNQKLVIIDFEAQTVTDVANIPLHAKRYSSPMFIEDGKAYVSVETETDAYVYQIDIESAVGTQGAKIIGKTIKGFYKL